MARGAKHKGRGDGWFSRGAAASKARPRGNIGCVPGDPRHRALPWATHEGLPPLPRRWNDSLPAWQATRPKRCALLVDRHVHKNGGSSIRDMLLENERMGYGLYQGYTQMYWQKDFKQLRRLVDAALDRGETPELLYMMEAHFGWVEFARSVMPDLQRLAEHLKKKQVDCPLVTMTRVREPLEYYLSFYRWAVAFRQKADPHLFGKDFLDWAQRIPNLQSTTMMQSMAAMAAEYFVHQWGSYHRAMGGGKGAAAEEAGWKRLQAFLDQFTIVASMQRFDESVLLASDLSGLPLILYKRNKPQQKGGFRGTSADVCPDMEKCREVIKKVAPMDYLMYDKYSQLFEERLKSLGEDFARRVQLYKRALVDVQASWKQVPRKQYLCRYHPETSIAVETLREENIRCPVGQGTAFCQATYAHRLFECPWQYQPNSSLSDPLGCWRPSSGFN
ncbi:hypothetical protein AB1Y20_013531 [Prymnesium parvum]|uniref:Uncharacterized protein n=1 Tax=Prymnesium parvum TaxID=97485 RepID=A0AB34IFT5_PRYPA